MFRHSFFTGFNPENVKARLQENGLWDNERPNRLFIKQKTEISNEAELFRTIEDWLRAMPTVYVLKEWENSITTAKNSMFLEMYGYSPYWVKIIWDMIKVDSINNSYQFGEFVTRNLVNRINGYSFKEDFLDAEKRITPIELARVVEGERYLEYSDQPDQAYTGDLFKKNGDYYLNIRAQCEISRLDQRGEYDPLLYCIKGKRLRNQDIITEDIKITSEEELVFSAQNHFRLDSLLAICHDEDKLPEFNRNFTKHRNSIFFNKGEILEKKLEVIVACIAGEQAIRFTTELVPMKYGELLAYRKGRILPPYITRIQQKCAQCIVREGVMPIPKQLFESFDE